MIDSTAKFSTLKVSEVKKVVCTVMICDVLLNPSNFPNPQETLLQLKGVLSKQFNFGFSELSSAIQTQLVDILGEAESAPSGTKRDANGKEKKGKKDKDKKKDKKDNK